MSSVKIAPDSSQRGRPAAKVPLSTHSWKGSVATGARSARPVACCTAR